MELQPCPFCGAKAQVSSVIGNPPVTSGVRCPDSDCPGYHIGTGELPPSTWNRRAVDVDAILKVAEEIRDSARTVDLLERNGYLPSWLRDVSTALRKSCGK